MQKTIFVVDDIDTNLAMANEALKEHYRVMTLPSAAKMFKLLEKIKPDLILLDIEMPEMDGFEALKRLKENNSQADIPVIFLTSMTDNTVEVRGFQLGVVDFVIKPFSTPVLINRIKTHLDIDSIIRERTSKLQNLQNAIIFGFADMVEGRDEGTGGHVDRTAAYVRILVEAMAKSGIYADEIKQLDLDSFVSSARLHDVGKIAISDIILNKPGKLTDEEFAIMKTHTTEGEGAIDQIISRTDDVEFLLDARLFAGSHHERWDGKGYPYRLAGENIPIHGRVMAFADVYDALVSERPYKKAFSSEEAIKIIMEGAGTQFDPAIADVFYEIRKQFEAVKI
ncbi:MAG: response regulator [Oscillospiraceae bacterium]|jgi:putative two-component system response regulator|nr:response regulator [Oscillospiraceae bacterium]